MNKLQYLQSKSLIQKQTYYSIIPKLIMLESETRFLLLPLMPIFF